MFGSKGFLGGIHPDSRKLTAGSEIEESKLPEKVILPLRQHVGATCDPLVEEGDHVKTGQKIADTGSAVSAPVHASISGTVLEISEKLCPEGEEIESVVIESDGNDEWVETEGIDPDESSREEILAKIREGGVVGLGGAAFPTHVKLKPPEDKDIDTVIINGAECEPYITADHRLMLEQGEKILDAARIISKLVSADRIIVAVEENKPDAIENLERLSGEDVEVISLEEKYPQGDERHLINSVLDREIPPEGLPFDVGVVVQNVGTAKAIYDAVYEGIPVIERVVSVTGDVQNPKNLLVRIGKSFFSLIEECGGPRGDMRKVISGGPMMGVAQSRDVPVVKGTTSILVFNEDRVKEEEEMPCIRCGRCIEACPMNMMPTKLVDLVRKEKWEEAKDYGIMRCDLCGSCAYVCPSKIPFIEEIKKGQEHLRSQEE